MKQALSLAGTLALMMLAHPTFAQSSMPGMDHSSMPGIDHSTMPANAPSAPIAIPENQPSKSDGSMSAPATTAPMDHSSMPGMDHASMPGMKSGSMPEPQANAATGASGTALPAGSAPVPAMPRDNYADRQFDKADMDRARAAMMHEQGGQSLYQVMLNLAEIQVYQGQVGYRWDGQAWFGTDIDRFVLKSEGGGSFREGFDGAEVQGLYSHAIGPYFYLQAGARQDLSTPLHQTYGAIAIEGLAPYWFEVSGALFVSTRGNVLARLEGYYDQNITQRLILQPRVELNFAAQNAPEDGIGVGLSNAELGLRLRYEITREFAPYIGISYDTKVGQTAAYATQAGRASSILSFVAGARVWF
jgi:copper resistance protein B